MAAVKGIPRVKLVQNPKYVRNGPKSYARVMQKYSFNPTLDSPFAMVAGADLKGQSVVDKALSLLKISQTGRHGHNKAQRPHLVKRGVGATGTSGEVPADDIQHDAQYLASVAIGTPAQKFNLDFDTGSADLWVWSTALDKSTVATGRKAGHAIFDSSKSSTFQSMAGETWQIQYGDGSTASGSVGTDNVTIGELTIRKQGVELAKQLSTAFQQGAGDGLLGLAWSNINTAQPTPLKTPVENMILQSDIPKTAELFTAYLTNSADSVEPFYTFGAIDTEIVQANGGNISYTPVDNSQGFWQFSSTSSSVNGQQIQISGGSAIADTGTTLALVDDATCKAVYAAIPGATYDSTQGGYIFPSTVTADQLPTVTFDIGGQPLTIHKEDLSFADAGNGSVYGGIQSRGDMTFSIFGDTALKAMYAVFDQGNTRFGFVQKTDPSASSSTSTGTNQSSVKAEL